MKEAESGKNYRILSIYTRLLNGRLVNKAEEADRFQVNEKSIQRDLEDIREFLDRQGLKEGVRDYLIYDYDRKGYRLERGGQDRLTNDEILAVCKILLDSRAFTKNEMMNILDKLIADCTPKSNQKAIYDLIANERYHYIELQHQKEFLDKLTPLGQAIRECRVIEIKYGKLLKRKTVVRRLKPLAIMFSEFYFYVVGIIDGIDRDKAFQNPEDPYPTIYRIDRIEELRVLDEHFKIPYANRFEEGEFRKRVQFMVGGKLRKVKFECKSGALEAVFDRLPTANILDEQDGSYVIEAEVFGNGIDMWLRSQGEWISLLR